MEIKKKYISDIELSLCQNFDCGGEDESMSFFLRDEALMCYKKGEAVTHVLLTEDEKCIVGYFSLKCANFQLQETDSYTGEIKNIVYPAVEIARFAIAANFQSKKHIDENVNFSEYMMQELMADIYDIRQYAVGVRAIILFSVNRDKQLHFYKKMGFGLFIENVGVNQSTENEGCVPMYQLLA